MNTLKLTALTMFIPLGWAVSADAYPQKVEETEIAQEIDPSLSCRMSEPLDRTTNPQKENTAAIQRALGAYGELRRRTKRDVNNAQIETCWLELDHIEID